MTHLSKARTSAHDFTVLIRAGAAKGQERSRLVHQTGDCAPGQSHINCHLMTASQYECSVCSKPAPGLSHTVPSTAAVRVPGAPSLTQTLHRSLQHRAHCALSDSLLGPAGTRAGHAQATRNKGPDLSRDRSDQVGAEYTNGICRLGAYLLQCVRSACRRHVSDF